MNEYQRAAQIIDNYYFKNNRYVNIVKVNTDEENKKLVADFQKRYSAEWLKSVKKEEVLEKVFDFYKDDLSDNKSLIYILKDQGPEALYAHFGHLSSRTNHFPIYPYRMNTWKVGYGFKNVNAELPENEARELAFKLKECIADALIEIGEDGFNTYSDYANFANKIYDECGYKPLPWLHKYLHMLYPTAFSDFHTKVYKVKTLALFDIESISDNQFDLAYQIAEIFKYSSIDYYYDFACTFYAIPGYTDYIKGTHGITADEIKRILKRYEEVDTLPIVEKIESEINATNVVGETKEALVKVRVNQGVFRDLLLKKYDHCCLCGVSNPDLLLASHIKPWSVSKAKEKLDVDNGFLLCPHHDKLFDKGYISFDDQGAIMISNQLTSAEQALMNVSKDMRLDLSDKNREYLKYHREHIFKS